jgi:hypothetical protein
MTPNEFKAWFDGFTEAFEGRIPTKAQWGRIKERVAEIDGKPVTERVYVDRYWPTYSRTIPSYPITTWTNSGGIGTSTGTVASGTSYSLAQNASSQIGSGGAAFNSMQAMNELGRADAAALGAQ